MTDRYARIRQALAMGPTRGPWSINTAGVGVNGKIVVNEIYVYNPEVADDVAIAADIIDPETGEPSEANARLIVACDPDTIRALLEERDALRRALSRILENEASDYKAAEEFGGYVLDDELREEARAALAQEGGQ